MWSCQGRNHRQSLIFFPRSALCSARRNLLLGVASLLSDSSLSSRSEDRTKCRWLNLSLSFPGTTGHNGILRSSSHLTCSERRSGAI